MLTGKQLAERLKLHPRFIARLANEGAIPFVHLDGWKRFKEPEVAARIFDTLRVAPKENSERVLGNDWLTTDEAAELLGVSKDTLLRWAERGSVQYFKFGPKTFRFRRRDMERI